MKKQKEMSVHPTLVNTMHQSIIKNKTGKTSSNGGIVILIAAVQHTIKAKLGMPRTDEAYLRKSRNMQAAILANARGYYSPAFNRLSACRQQNTKLNDAINDIKNGRKGGAKKKATADLKITLNLALGYINSKAFLYQSNAELIIKCALMVVIKRSPRNKKDLTASQGDVTGEIKLAGIAVRVKGKLVRASYDWEYSIDGGTTWDDLDGTTKANTVAKKMKVGVVKLFRMRKKSSKTGASTWFVSKPITPE